MLVHCGSQVEGKERSALIYLHGDYEKPGHKPKKVLELAKAKIETSSNTPPGSHTSSPNTMGTSPYISSPPNFSTSPPSSGSSSEHLFQIIIGNETNEFKAENEEDRLRWVKLLGLLVMFPYSAIPLEPEQNPIKDTFRFKLNPKAYGAGKQALGCVFIFTCFGIWSTHTFPPTLWLSFLCCSLHWD